MTSTPALPNTRTWPFPHGGRTLDVTIGYVAWPEIIITVAERGHDQAIEARFREDGTMPRLTFTSDHGEITAADLRKPVMTVMQQWEAYAREAARCILAGEPEPEPGPHGPAEAIRMLMYGTARPRGTRKRGHVSGHLLPDLAAAYRQAVAAGDPAPRLTLARQFGYSPAHIGRLLVQARKNRLLGPAPRGKAGETTPEPRAA